jgi:hypothetical protein
MMMRHLDLSDWIRVPIIDQLDALGEVATGALRDHGVYWPPQAHSMRVFAQHAGAGSLMTGGGGDELFIGWSQRKTRRRDILKLRPRGRAAKWLAFSMLPDRLQTELMLARQSLPTPWMPREYERQLERAWRSRSRARTKSWGEVLENFIHSRYLEFLRSFLEAFALDYGVRLYEPFYDPRVIRAVVREAPHDGYASRTAALEAHFSDLLPEKVLQRSTKAVFTEAAWGPGARAFAQSWDGTGLDERYVNVSVLREEWASERPHPRTIPCLQTAWVASQASA